MTKERKDKNTEKSKGVVTLLYVKGVTEQEQDSRGAGGWDHHGWTVWP